MARTLLASCIACMGLTAWVPALAQTPAQTPAQMADAASAATAPAAAPASGAGLTLVNFARMVARSDELVRAQALEETIAGQGVRGAQAVYEPFLTTSLSRDGRYVPTTAEEYFSRGSSATQPGGPLPFESRVSQLKMAVGTKASTGADLELSYTVDSIVNSLQARANVVGPEYRGSLGFSVTQPLMRNLGKEVTESGIRVAEREEAIARETVRQVTAQRVAESLQAYLFVQRAQERVRWRQQALAMATQLETEMARQHEVGLKSLNELTEARAGLALRQAQLAQAQQDLEEQANALQVFLSAQPDQTVPPSASRWMPADELRLPEDQFADSLKMTDPQTAYEMRPETRVNRLRIEREDLRSDFARNQTKPDLNFRIRYGRDSLTTGRPIPLDNYLDRGLTPYNSWGVALTLRVGLEGDAKKDSEYQTTMLRKSQAELALGAAQQRIVNELLGIKAVLERAVQLASRQSDIVKAQSELLATEKRMMSQGQKSLLDVLRREIEVALAREALSDAIAQVNRSSFVASQVNGGLLSRLGLE